MTFDGPNKLIVLTAGDGSVVSVRQLWSRWVDWLLTGDNSKFLPAFAQVGGQDIDATAGTAIPIYAFLLNGWRIRPREANHTLTINDGVLLVDGGGDPFVNTVGSFVVRVAYSQPVQAITVATGGGGGGGGLEADERDWLMALALRHGLVLGSPVAISPTGISAPGLTQTINESGGVVTVTRQ